MINKFLTAFFEAIRSQDLSQIVHYGVLASKLCLFIPYFYTQNEIVLAQAFKAKLTGDFKTAIEIFEVLTKEAPDYYFSRMLGQSYFGDKQYQFSHGHNYNKFYLGFVGFEHGLLAVRTHT